VPGFVAQGYQMISWSEFGDVSFNALLGCATQSILLRMVDVTRDVFLGVLIVRVELEDVAIGIANKDR